MNFKLKLGLSLTAVAIVALASFSLYHQSQLGTLNLTIVPNDSVIKTADGKIIKNGSGLIHGDYKLVLSRQYFDSKTITATITKGKKFSLTIALAPNSESGRQYMLDHPDQAAIADGIGSQHVNATAESNAKTYPILSKLPTFVLKPSYWRIDYGRSAKYPTDPSKIALYVTADDQPSRDAALKWITAQGDNPARYEIIYQSSAAYIQQVNSTASSQNLHGE